MTDPTPPAAPRPCECGHAHATAEQDGVVSVFHRCRVKGCECREYRPAPDGPPRCAHGFRFVLLCPDCTPDDPRPVTPSKPSSGDALGGTLDAYVAEMTRLTRDTSQVESVRAARTALDRAIAALIARAPTTETPDHG